MEIKQFFGKNKGKGYWKIWQIILVDANREPFPRELRKMSSKINSESTENDRQTYRYAKELVSNLSENTVD